jgi:hypothetical protein
MCNNYVKTKDQKTVLELSRRESLRKFHALFEYKYTDKSDDYLDQILMTFSEFTTILKYKNNLLKQLLPNVYDYEKFFTFQIENDFVIINEKSLPNFTKYCRGIFKHSSINIDYLFPKIILLKNQRNFDKSSELMEENIQYKLHSSSSNLINSKLFPTIDSTQNSKRVFLIWHF